MDSEMEKILRFIQDWKNHPYTVDYYSVIWKKCHYLANSKYLPAKKLFIEGLDDTDWVWRNDCITLLGYHYSLDIEILEKIKYILTNDQCADVRISAASVLGNRSIFPDYALINALLMDIDEHVRMTALYSFLQLAKVPIMTINQEIRRIKTEGIKLTIDEVKKIFITNGLLLEDYIEKKSDE